MSSPCDIAALRQRLSVVLRCPRGHFEKQKDGAQNADREQARAVGARLLRETGAKLRRIGEVMGTSNPSHLLDQTLPGCSKWDDDAEHALLRWEESAPMDCSVEAAYLAMGGELSEGGRGPRPSDPSPEEIRERAEGIRAGWDEDREQRRRIGWGSAARVFRLHGGEK